MLKHLVLAAALLLGSLTAYGQKPNVVIVITDDQGYGDLSCHGNPVLKTPKLDELYSQSVRLTDYHVAPTCSPTRAALMTGHWTNRTGVWHTINGRSMIRENEVTIGQAFKENGYATGMFGKWHLGDNYPYRPEDRGFTEVMRHGGGGIGQTPDYWDNAYFDGSYWHNGTPTPVKGYCTDVFFDYAKSFIKAQKKAGKPFLAYISTNAPHGPNHSPIEFSEPYADDHDVKVSNFFGMIANIDKNVGDLRQMLDDEGLTENTIFIFTTDNGTAGGAKVFNDKMRGKKGSEYDGGHRVPFFIHWPAGNLNGGRDISQLTAHVDVLPTLLKLCDGKDPEGVKFDGSDISPLLSTEELSPEAATHFAERILVTDSQRVKDPIKWRKSAVMSGSWRLINGKELYDRAADPEQRKNVIKDNPEVAARMKDFYDAWWAELEPTFANETPIYIGHPNENPARLTSHDWITEGATAWNQAQIRKAINEEKNTGFWNIKVHEAGTYRIELRRWPKEIDRAIELPLEPGADVPGVKALRAIPGVAISPTKCKLTIGDTSWTEEVSPGDTSVTFTVPLTAGRIRMAGLFIEADGDQYGTYYAYVTKEQ